MNLDYWIQLYQELRQRGEYTKADQLREMIRRMGYEIRVSKEKVTVVQK